MGVAQSHNMIPNMILLYKEDTDHNKEKKDIDKFVGFNLRNLSQLRFKDYSQFVDGLVERLEKHYGCDYGQDSNNISHRRSPERDSVRIHQQ